jgi:Methyltransferase domain
MTDIYADGSYLAKNPGWHRHHSGWKASYLAGLWEERGLTPLTVCEVGCGAGGILTALSDRFPRTRFTGYEISPDAYALCVPSARVEFRLQDFLETTETYDLLLLADVVEHVEDYLGFLKAVRARADWKMMLIPLDISAQTVVRTGRLSSIRDQVGHLHFFTKEIALDALASTGYEVVSCRYVPAALEAPGLPARAKLVRWPRRAVARLNADLAANLLGGFSLLVLAR